MTTRDKQCNKIQKLQDRYEGVSVSDIICNGQVWFSTEYFLSCFVSKNTYILLDKHKVAELEDPKTGCYPSCRSTKIFTCHIVD